MKPVEPKSCFAIFCAGDPVGTITEDGQPTVWETHATEREAQLSIVEDMEEYIRQFKEGKFPYEDIVPDLYVVPVELHPDGSLSSPDGDWDPPEQH